MTLNDIYSQLYSFRLSDLVPLAAIQTEEDKNAYQNTAYCISYTEAEWKAKYPDVDTSCLYYAPMLVCAAMVYFDKEKLIWASLPVIPGLQSEIDKNFPGNFLKTLCELETLAKNGEREKILLYMPDSIRMEIIGMLLEQEEPSPKLYHYFKLYYPVCDCFTSMFPEDFAERLKQCKSEEQESETAEALAHIKGDTIRVYRGCANSSAAPDKALSWTEDISIAYLFALKAGDDPRILCGTVSKENVLERFDGTEKEVVVVPGSVVVESEEWMYSADNDDIVAIAQKFHPIYDATRQEIEELYEDRSSNHDASHSLRVAFLSLMLGSLEGLSNSRLRMLATAAAYHDIGREDDEAATNHGIRSAELYKEAFGKHAEPTVAYLIRNHCTSDEQGMAQAKSKHEKKLLAILKDADALDRLRFGYPNSSPSALDISQLRLKESMKLIAIAKSAVNGLSF